MGFITDLLFIVAFALLLVFVINRFVWTLNYIFSDKSINETVKSDLQLRGITINSIEKPAGKLKWENPFRNVYKIRPYGLPLLNADKYLRVRGVNRDGKETIVWVHIHFPFIGDKVFKYS